MKSARLVVNSFLLGCTGIFEQLQARGVCFTNTQANSMEKLARKRQSMSDTVCWWSLSKATTKFMETRTIDSFHCITLREKKNIAHIASNKRKLSTNYRSEGCDSRAAHKPSMHWEPLLRECWKQCQIISLSPKNIKICKFGMQQCEDR